MYNLLTISTLRTELLLICQKSVKMSVKYPKVKFDSKQRIYVSFYLNNKRYRFFNGKKINVEIYPNSFPIEKRLEMGKLLAAEVYKFITSELAFNGLISENKKQYCINDMQYFKLALENKLKGDYSLQIQVYVEVCI